MLGLGRISTLIGHPARHRNLPAAAPVMKSAGGMMRGLRRWLRLSAPGAAVGALALSASGLAHAVAAPAPAAPRASLGAIAQTGPVSPVPAGGTPELAPTSKTEQVRQLVECGGTIF